MPNQSGDKNLRSNKSSKRGSPYLRKTLFNIMSCYLKTAPEDEPIFQFLDRKRAEGKPYYVYMTAAANKFLRRYYAKVRDYLVVVASDDADSGQSLTDWGGFAALNYLTAPLTRTVKDAAGAAQLFILDWPG